MTDTSKFTVTSEMTDAFYSKAEVTSRGTILNLEAAIEAMLAAAPEQKPVAYAAFAKNGNIRIWSQEPGRIDATAAVDGFEVKPLYTHPASEEITALRSLLEQAEKERDAERSSFLAIEAESNQLREVATRYRHRAEAAEKALADAHAKSRSDAKLLSRYHTLLSRHGLGPSTSDLYPNLDYKPGHWFEVQSIDEMQDFYLSRLTAIREAAKEHGYAIGLHGSERRDFDLMAMQWRENPSDKNTLAHAIAMAACGLTRDGQYQWTEKPVGRVATSIPVCWPTWYDMIGAGNIDLSLIDAAPSNIASEKALADATMSPEVINLVIAAREACDSWVLAEDEFKALDKALEPFSERVPYENEPDDETTP